MIKYLPYILIVFLFINACSVDDVQKGEGGYDQLTKNSKYKIISDSDFQRIDSLKYEVVEGIEKTVFDPKFIEVSDTLLLIVDNNTKEIFQFFDLSNFSKVASFGNKGEGPGEVSTPAFINHNSFIDNDRFEYLDWGRKTLSVYSLEQILSTDEPVSVKEYMLPPKIISVQRAVFLEDNTVIGIGGIRDGKLVKASMTNDSVLAVTPYTPLQENALEYATVGYIYTGEITINKEKEEIVVIMPRFKMIEFYDYNLNLLRDVRFEENPKTLLGENGSSARSETMRYYNDLAISGEHIYALYLGNELGSYRAGEEIKNSEIHIFDWEGNPIKKLALNTNLSRIAVDKKNGRIFGISAYDNSVEYPLVYFNLD
jgi:hypothetical protein